MIKLHTIGQMTKVAKNDPTVVAAVDTLNGYIHTIGADHKAVAPVAGAENAPQTQDLWIALNVLSGDERYTDAVIPAGKKLNSFLLKQWAHQCLVADENNITYAANETYDSIVENTTVFIAGTDGKLAIAEDTANYGLYFKATKKVMLNGVNAVQVEIILA